MSHVKAFKLVGGEEVVASVVDEVYENKMLTENQSKGEVKAYVVRRPHILRFQPVSPGQVGLAFVPWTLSNPTIERLTIPASAVVLVFDPSDQVEQQYIQQTTGLEITRGSGANIIV